MRQVKSSSDLLRIIDEGIAPVVGVEFFESLVCSLSTAFESRCAFVSEFCSDASQVTTLAMYLDGRLTENIHYSISGTPCEAVLSGEIVAFHDRLIDQFPLDRSMLEPIGARSYLAVPLKCRTGKVTGHLAVIDDRPRRWVDTDKGMMRIFAARANAEIQRRQFETMLSEARRSAESANRAKSNFLAHMSHELRTPVNGILGYAQLVRADNAASPQVTAHAQAIERCGEHLLNLINEALDISRIEAGHLELRVEEIDLQDLLDEIADVIRLRADLSGLEFTCDKSPQIARRILIDSHRLRQVLLNLLGNAIKFTAHGRVRLAVQPDPVDNRQHRIRFDVEDSGIGIAESELNCIFEPFYQVASDNAMDGTGLGLAIVKRLIGAMDGAIEVHSEPGRGSRFSVWLDALPVEGHDNEQANQQPETPEAMLLPPPEELTRITQLARSGDVVALETLFTHLEISDPRLAPCLGKLRRFAAQFDLRGLRRFVNHARVTSTP